MLLEVTRNVEAGTIQAYVLEYTGKDSAVVKYELSADYLGGLRVMAKNDM